MRNKLARTAIGLTAATALGVAATPAAARPVNGETGLTFYVSKTFTPVKSFPQPDRECGAVPPAADLLVGWSGLENVHAFSTSDCSGTRTALGTLRSITPGKYQSFRTE